jgi:beta-glucosidase
MDHAEIIKRMSLEEKIALCSGQSFWETKDFKALNIPSIFMFDGPHGLRKIEVQHHQADLGNSVKSTCFPTSSTLAASWDIKLTEEIGLALGKEAIKLDTNMILGPGVNMKRNPLCGRNFEYYSEDPFLAGKLAASWIRGVQDTGTGTSLKHFALNNQELKRMTTDVLIDERALREYYLPAFEIAVKEAQPTTVMCAYNKVEGKYCSDHEKLLREILREEWGFDGAVVTDWGAMNDRIQAFRAGTDLEMPGSKGRFDLEVKSAVLNGELEEDFIDESVDRLLSLIESVSHRDQGLVTEDLFVINHDLARKAAEESAVLLKNVEQILPLRKSTKLAILGELAKTPRYQGSGSSLVNPTQLTNLLESLRQYVPDAAFTSGYTLEDVENKSLVKDAVEIARHAEVVVLCLGLTAIFESEGYDREHMSIPNNQVRLLEAVAQVNKNIVIILVGGSAMEMPWVEHAKAVLLMQLAGQAGGEAAVNLLFGTACPSGKLAESYPYLYQDVVNSTYYNHRPKQAPYLESLYCGYRYFSSANVPVRYPFGYGLSYTKFEYSNMVIDQVDQHAFTITIDITNVGGCDGADIVQLYISPKTNGAYRPILELKGFDKVFLKQNETKTIVISLDQRSFAIYDIDQHSWIVESGEYEILVGASSEDIRLKSILLLKGKAPKKSECSDWYYTLDGVPTREDFLTIHEDFEVYTLKTKGTYDMTSSIEEMKETSFVAKIMYKAIERTVAKPNGGKVDYNNVGFKMLMKSAADNPMKSMPLFSPDQMPLKLAQFLVDASNGYVLKGFLKLLLKRNSD